MYPSGQRTPPEVIQVLRRLKHAQRKHHLFWPDEVSHTDTSLFREEYVIGSKQVTDVYLLGLAVKRGAKLVSFDRTLPLASHPRRHQELG